MQGHQGRTGLYLFPRPLPDSISRRHDQSHPWFSPVRRQQQAGPPDFPGIHIPDKSTGRCAIVHPHGKRTETGRGSSRTSVFPPCKRTIFLNISKGSPESNFRRATARPASAVGATPPPTSISAANTNVSFSTIRRPPPFQDVHRLHDLQTHFRRYARGVDPSR